MNQPPERAVGGTDPFACFGIEPSFALDLSMLEQRYREIAKVLHPDRFQIAAERRNALSQAMLANEAYRTLRCPIRRAEALFARYGVATGERHEPPAPPALLMQILEQREALSEARAARDLPSAVVIAGHAKRREEQIGAGLAQGFSEIPSAADPTAQARALLPLLAELRYLRRIQDEVRALQDEADEADH